MGSLFSDIITWLGQNPTLNVPIAVATIASITALLVSLFNIIIWPYVKRGIDCLARSVWSRVTGRAAEKRYLDWVIQQHQFLPALPTSLIPTDDRKPQHLDLLYVALTFSDEATRDGIQLSQAIRRHPRMVVLGNPGAGKTTMLRYIALTLAQARGSTLGSTEQDAADVKHARLRSIKRRVRDDWGFKRIPLPIFVYLNRYRDVESWAAGRSVLDAIRDEWKSVDVVRSLPADFLERKLARGECVFLFDAFDELGTQDARHAVARRVADLATAVPAGNRLIVSSRIVGYKGQLSEYGFQAITVQPLSRTQMGELIRGWYRVISQSHLADRLINTLDQRPQIYDLGTNPMLLALIALVQYVRGLIPDRRHILYEECLNILVERRHATLPVQEYYNSVLPSVEAMTILKNIGHTMHRNKLREIQRPRLETDVIPSIASGMAGSKASALSGAQILANIEERSQLLIERGVNEKGQLVMAFLHQTFQEYLTSVYYRDRALRRSEDVVATELIREHDADAEWWEETVLLYAAQLEGASRTSFLEKVKLEPSTRE